MVRLYSLVLPDSFFSLSSGFFLLLISHLSSVHLFFFFSSFMRSKRERERAGAGDSALGPRRDRNRWDVDGKGWGRWVCLLGSQRREQVRMRKPTVGLHVVASGGGSGHDGCRHDCTQWCCLCNWLWIVLIAMNEWTAGCFASCHLVLLHSFLFVEYEKERWTKILAKTLDFMA